MQITEGIVTAQVSTTDFYDRHRGKTKRALQDAFDKSRPQAGDILSSV